METEYYNFCKVALYTGLRKGELLSVEKIDIEDNIINVKMEDTSSKKHSRIMPIHENIKSIIDYQIKTNKGKYLFFDISKRNTKKTVSDLKNEIDNIGRNINRRINKFVPNPDKTLHSFRKNFSQEIELNTNAEESIKKYLMSHTMKKDITHNVYNRGKVNTNKLWDCINQITFKY